MNGDSSTLTIEYTTTVPFLDNSYIYMHVPKATNMYDTGNNNVDEAYLMLIPENSDSDVLEAATITLGG